MDRRGHHQDGDIGCSQEALTGSASNYPQTRQRWGNPRTYAGGGGEAEAPPWTRDRAGRVRRARRSAALTASPLLGPAHFHSLSASLGSRFLQGKKRAPG